MQRVSSVFIYLEYASPRRSMFSDRGCREKASWPAEDLCIRRRWQISLSTQCIARTADNLVDRSDHMTSHLSTNFEREVHAAVLLTAGCSFKRGLAMLRTCKSHAHFVSLLALADGQSHLHL